MLPSYTVRTLTEPFVGVVSAPSCVYSRVGMNRTDIPPQPLCLFRLLGCKGARGEGMDVLLWLFIGGEGTWGGC